MKYIVLALLLVLTATGKPVGIAGQPMTYDAVGSFHAPHEHGVDTLVIIHLQARGETTILAISIRRSRQSCGQGATCGVEPLFAGSATRRIADRDATVDRHLAWTSLHTRLPVFDAVSNASVEVTLDVQWSASGALAPTPHGLGGAFSRDATASGLVTSPSLGTISLALTSPGTLSRHPGD